MVQGRLSGLVSAHDVWKRAATHRPRDSHSLGVVLLPLTVQRRHDWCWIQRANYRRRGKGRFHRPDFVWREVRVKGAERVLELRAPASPDACNDGVDISESSTRG